MLIVTLLNAVDRINISDQFHTALQIFPTPHLRHSQKISDLRRQEKCSWSSRESPAMTIMQISRRYTSLGGSRRWPPTSSVALQVRPGSSAEPFVARTRLDPGTLQERADSPPKHFRSGTRAESKWFEAHISRADLRFR